jgi:hypothetical protein
MALPYDQITAMTHALIEDSAADNFFDSNPLFYWLKEKGQVIIDGGTHIQEPIVYDDVDASGKFQNYDVLDTTPNEQHTAAKADIKRYYTNIVISRHELLRASGKEAVINLLDSKVQVGNMTMAQQISTDLHSANDDAGLGIVGLRRILSTTSTLHGIATADAPVWKAKQGTLTGSVLTLRDMDNLWEDLSVGNDVPKMIVTTRGGLSKYKSLLVANQRFGEAEKVSGGFRAVMFNDAPVFADPNVTSGAGTTWMYMLNPAWLKLYIHRDDNFTSTPFPVTPNQDVVGSRLTASLQMVCNNRRLQGFFSDINPAL